MEAKNVRDFNDEFICEAQLIYGEWEFTEYLGGGMHEFSHGAEARILEGTERKRLSIYPNYVKANDIKEEGDVFALFRIIPEKFIYDCISPWVFNGDVETELKCEEQDFYLMGDIITDNDKINELLDYKTGRWIVRDANTIIIADIDGFYKLERFDGIL